MKLLNRRDFRKLWPPDLSGPDGPLWVPEQSTGKKSRHFVSMTSLPDDEYDSFWRWCQKNCRGQVLCYSFDTDNKIAWYGFSHRPDLVPFILRWS